MKRREPVNMAASVHERLLNRARSTGQAFNDLLQHYALERFLARLAESPHRENFVLKGALLLRVWDLAAARPTLDVDLLGHLENDVRTISGAVREICATAVEPDGLSFDVSSIRAEAITEDAAYHGVRVNFVGYLGNARIHMQVDVGFGDPVTPRTEDLEYPCLLNKRPPRVRAYPPETTIAEKFQVMLFRGRLNSRMKDFFDIWALARSRRFEGPVLAEAVRRTCQHRGTPVPREPAVLTGEALADPVKQRQWDAFRRRLRGINAPATFEEVGAAVRAFMKPVAAAVASGEALQRVWPPGGPWSA